MKYKYIKTQDITTLPLSLSLSLHRTEQLACNFFLDKISYKVNGSVRSRATFFALFVDKGLGRIAE